MANIDVCSYLLAIDIPPLADFYIPGQTTYSATWEEKLSSSERLSLYWGMVPACPIGLHVEKHRN
jgi:hypothetical protein